MTPSPRETLRREVGVFGATMMGLGSIVGTGVFVSLAIAAGAAGPAVVISVALAALVATCNGLSSAQLAAAHPVSGGAYEYGYRWLSPQLGFLAGWLFLCAKSASAATAALGFAGYALHLFAISASPWLIPLAALVVVGITLLVLFGIRLSNGANMVVVSITLVSLAVFVIAGLPMVLQNAALHWRPLFAPVEANASPWFGVLEATALMFVAYTGYGRIATLGEEITNPRRNIPLAIIVTLGISAALYLGVAIVAVGSIGAPAFNQCLRTHAAPLEAVAQSFALPGVAILVAAGALSAMLGVLLNLVLGLSRVVLAMARRSDFPASFAAISAARSTPWVAVLFVGGLILALVLIGDVKTTWTFSAFTVLIYYAVTNLAAIQLKDDERRYPRFVAILGLVACLFLAFWVPWKVWGTGLAIIAGGLVWQFTMRRLSTLYQPK